MSYQVTNLVDHFFREEYGKAVSYLTSKYGFNNLELAEDSVQEALYKAMKSWPYGQIPNNPTGWIITVASNKMIDHFRRSAHMDGADMIPEKTTNTIEVELETIQDDVVKMMFACCHPVLSTEYQIILTLKILGGLSIREIARALLKKEETVAKSYTRAKKKFQNENIQLSLPGSPEIKNRLRTVLHIIYLLFNEGYKTTEGDSLMQQGLCSEAIRLNGILLDNEACDISVTNSLMSLMYFHSSRFNARVNENGELITLKNQDRTKWDTELIAKGVRSLEQATQGSFLNEFYVQAAISGLHCEAKTYEETNWKEILGLYNTLLRLRPTAIIRLNRSVALAKATSADEALEDLKAIESDSQMKEYHLFHTIKAEFLHEIGNTSAAVISLKKAITLTNNQAEIAHLTKKLTALGRG